MAADPELPWLVLIHQLPPKPAYLRVKVWRRLQALGAVPIKNSVYVLPNTEEAREDFQWVLREIRDEGADASLCEARLLDGLTDEEIRRSFHAVREQDYRELAASVRAFVREALPARARKKASAESHAQGETALARFRKRLAEIEKIDFFAAPGREVVEGLLGELESKLSPGDATNRAQARRRRHMDEVKSRVWVTRAGVKVDRMASAWLIQRFIDRDARFKFVPGKEYQSQPGELRFDMFDAEFTHRGDLCTFEVLLADFGLSDRGLVALGEIIHDIDNKEAKFGRPETPGVDHLVSGIAAMHDDDERRLAQSAAIFDGLYAYFEREGP